MRIKKVLLGYISIMSVLDILLVLISAITQNNWYHYIASPIYIYKELFAAGILLNDPIKIAVALLPIIVLEVVIGMSIIRRKHYTCLVWPIVIVHTIIISFTSIILLVSNQFSLYPCAYFASAVIDIWVIAMVRLERNFR